MENVLVDQVASVQSATDAAALPERVREALGELAGAAREGLMALSVGVGLGVWTSWWPMRSMRSSDRAESTTRIEVRLEAQVTALHSYDDHLRAVTVTDIHGHEESLNAQALFLCIGGRPGQLGSRHRRSHRFGGVHPHRTRSPRTMAAVRRGGRSGGIRSPSRRACPGSSPQGTSVMARPSGSRVRSERAPWPSHWRTGDSGSSRARSVSGDLRSRRQRARVRAAEVGALPIGKIGPPSRTTPIRRATARLRHSEQGSARATRVVPD